MVKRDQSSARTIAVMYLRVSSKEQEIGGFSIDAQRRLLEQYAEEHSIKVLQVYTDVETAKRAGRTEFGKMIAFLRGNEGCRAILVEKTDRLYRNISDWVTLDSIPGLVLHMVKEGTILSEESRSSEKFIHGIKVLMAKNYIDNLSEESKKGMLEKARQGIWPSFAPIGYINVLRQDGKKAIEPDPVRAPIVRMMFERYAEGDSSLKDLVKLSRQAGLCLSGRKRTYGKAALSRVLRNPIYKGSILWDGQTFEGIHTPLVSPELWQRVQDTIDGNRKLKGRRVKHDYLFARLVTCGHCGGLMTGQMQKGKLYYHCSGYYGKCLEPYLRTERLENAFCGILKALEIDDEVMEWSRTGMLLHREEQALYREREGKRLQADYDAMKHRFEAIYEDKLDGKVPEWLFQEKSNEYQRKMADLLEGLRRIEADEPLDVDKIEKCFELARRASTRFSELSEPDKRKLLRSVVLNCSWKDGELAVRFRQPFDMLAEAVTVWNEKKVAGLSDSDLFSIWYPRRDSNTRIE